MAFSMSVRGVCGKYPEVKFEDYDTTVISGLLDSEETAALIENLESVIEDLKSYWGNDE